MSLTPTELGKRLREARLKALLSQDDVGLRLGVARGTVARWESGTREISFSSLQQLAVALGSTVVDLLGDAPAAAPAPTWAGAAWEQLHSLERQAIEQIVALLAEHPAQLPAMLALVSDSFPEDREGPRGAVSVLQCLTLLDIDQLTPVAALAQLAELKRQLEEATLFSATALGQL